MSRPNKSSGQRKQELLLSAATLISKHGLTATTMPEVAAHAGLSVGGLYRHFSSKTELVSAMIQADAHWLHTQVSATPHKATLPEALLQWAMAQIGSEQQLDSFGLRLEILALASRDTAIGEMAKKHDLALEKVLRSRLKKAPANSLAREKPKLASELMAIVVDGIATRAAVAGKLNIHAEQLVQQVVDLILQPQADSLL